MGDNRGNEEEGTRVGGGKCVKIRSDLLALEMKEDEHLRKSREKFFMNLNYREDDVYLK
jgi:hypothetical protein